ncbi:hypothetical protein [Litorihabitans aurantiacus]|uniref:Uncharacterized protein n=1 Tax=Litorihabitans aurantiacus TaxID=1930061 RepID=A0AA37UU14_9MICO|nr:hypothetical protein [Litorihabitans aurantiacus]GMA30462.1 hypothetical protein GCM10025875_04540 [Litorihabitans aurantiacus]
MALAALLVVGGATACGGGPDETETDATCERDGCTDLPLEQIEDISGLDLPEGTEVVDSRYTSFQDWHLEATLGLPEGAEDPTVASGDDWAGVPDDDGVHRSVTTRTEDGRLVLEIQVFTT